MRLSLKEKKLQPIMQAYERVEQLYYDVSTNAFFAVRVDYVQESEDLHSGDTRKGTLWRSDDSCRSWTSLLGDEDGVECVAIAQSGTIVVGTDTSGVLKSSDHGKTWEYLGLGDAMVSSVAIYDTSIVFAVSENTAYAKMDESMIWKPIYSVETSKLLRFIGLSPDSYLYTGGWRVGLLESIARLPDLLR